MGGDGDAGGRLSLTRQLAVDAHDEEVFNNIREDFERKMRVSY